MKQVKYWLLILIITGVTIELSPFIISPVLYGHSFSRSKLKSELFRRQKVKPEEKEENKGVNQNNEYLGDHILHPYLGFVSIPGNGYNRFGFPGPDPLTGKSHDTVNICLMGGSVALGLYHSSMNRLIAKLKKSKAFRKKEFKVIVFALGGFKQPQQLLALNYFLSLGAHYDIVINLDGFNEIVLPYSDNLPFHVYPSYPRHWNIYSRKRLNTKVQLQLSKQLALKDEESKLAGLFIKNHFYYSNFGLFLWGILNNNKKLALVQTEEKLRQAISHSESDFQSTGPAETVTDTTRFFAKQAELWRRASTLINDIGKSEGFAYFHFLQPNQYYKNSKKLTKEELQVAFEQGPFSYKTAVQKGYPFLVKNGKLLTGQGINFDDLTLMFKNETRTVYNDKCCHFNELGYNLIADKISGYIVNYFDRKKQPLN
ncbi:MAG: hypothetical protein GXO86_03115 [Chlorobi bacterium]|nr:hypothetical protein [Chlorobiota bacterium]